MAPPGLENFERTHPSWPKSEDDWDRHRGFISHLYRDENKSLKAVMAAMSREYGFRASVRMYKSRITKWGLDKNNKKHEMEAILRIYTQRKAVGKGSTFEIRGRCVDMETVQRYLKRKGITEREVMIPQSLNDKQPKYLRCTTPEPSYRPAPAGEVTSPKFYGEPQRSSQWSSSTANAIIVQPMISESTYLLEDMLTAVRNYIIGSFEAGLWISDGKNPLFQDIRSVRSTSPPGAKTPSADLYTLICNSRRLIRQGDLSMGNIYLRNAFSLIKVIVATEDPIAVWELMNTISYLHEEGWNDILRSFLDSLANTAALLHTKTHPMYRIFSSFRKLLSHQVLHVMATMRQCAAELFETVTGILSVNAVGLRLGFLRATGLIQGHETVEGCLKILLAACRQQFGRHRVQCLLVLNRLAKNFYERSLYPEAEATGQEILQDVRSMGATAVVSVFIGKGLSLVSRAQKAQGKSCDAVRNLRHLLEHNAACYGCGDPLTVGTAALLEQWDDGACESADCVSMRAQAC